MGGGHINSFHLCEHSYWTLKRRDAFISPVVKENYLMKLIKNSFVETIYETVYIHIAHPENSPVQSVPIWIIVNGRFLSLQIISNLCFKLTENFFMGYSFHVIVYLFSPVLAVWIYEFSKKCGIALSQASSQL